jgi:beta-glucanase (GH16 family)
VNREKWSGPLFNKGEHGMSFRILWYSALLCACLLTNLFAAGGWKLFWSDEFNTDGFLDANNWWNRVVGPGWVNGEQQRYTAGHDLAGANVFVKGGYLIIEARKSGSEISSARLEGENLQNFMYGRMEARARLPISMGMWPAFWMQGFDINTRGVGWPAAGEIDIMEGKGRLPSWTSGAFHCTAGGPAGNYTLPSGAPNFHDAFHKFAIEWSQDTIRWYADSVNFLTMTKAQIPTAPINKNYFFLINLAVGGGFDGNSDNTTIFPESLIVDYVRVFHWDPNVGVPASRTRYCTQQATLADMGATVAVLLPYEQSYRCEVVSVSGKRMLYAAGTAKNFKITTAGFAPGAYFVNVRGAFGTLLGRCAVQK